MPLTAAAAPYPAHADDAAVAPGAAPTEEPSQGPASRARTLGLGARHAAVAILIGAPHADWVAAAAAVSGNAEPKLLWPIDGGKLLRGLGPSKLARKHQRGPRARKHRHAGLDIGAAEGTAIRAAQAGLVIYAARGVRGYGQLIVIVHADGSATMYAHCRKMDVLPGELIARGQTIGEVGQTGRARGPHLHFEYRVDGDARDPTALFE